MSDYRVLLMQRCSTLFEFVQAADGFVALDEVETRALFLLEFDLDDDYSGDYSDRPLVTLRIGEASDGEDLADRIRRVGSDCSHICFLPQGTIFGRSLGLRSAISVLQAAQAKLVFGLVRGPDGWQSDAGRSDIINDGETCFIRPIEIGRADWTPHGPFSFIDVDFGGDLVVCDISDLPGFVPTAFPGLTWGVMLALSDGAAASSRSVLYSGLQARVAERPSTTLAASTSVGQRFHDRLRADGLAEIVFLGRGRLARDDDHGDVVFQSFGRLDPLGNRDGAFSIRRFYLQQTSRALLGPLFVAEEEITRHGSRVHRLLPGAKSAPQLKRRVGELEIELAELQRRSVDRLKLNRLWEIVIKRSFLAMFGKRR